MNGTNFTLRPTAGSGAGGDGRIMGAETTEFVVVGKGGGFWEVTEGGAGLMNLRRRCGNLPQGFV